MKKKLILSLILLSCFIFYSPSFANNIEKQNYEIEETESYNKNNNIDFENLESIFESSNIKIFKINNKYGVYDKNNDSLLIEPVIEKIEQFNDKEFKLTYDKYVGYLNTENTTNFFTPYDNLFVYDKYIKTQYNHKYGLIDKDANLILKPIYEKVGIFYNDDGEEFISAKYEGKYKLYHNTGKLIPEEDLYVISNDGYYLLAQNIKPELKKYRYSNSTVYKKLNSTNENLIYEVEEIQIPDKIKTASIEKDVFGADLNKQTSLNKKDKISSQSNFKLVIVKENNKYGLNKINGEIIIPAIYDKIIPTKPCKHYKKPIFVTVKDGIISEHNSSGKLIAEQVYDKINFYKYGKVYTYKNENGIWNLRCNGKLIGNLIYKDNKYRYTKSGFHLFGVHKINELFITILENSK